jgi:hypothetical protein
MSCPTCWCFDIQDETRGKSGVRMRNWDSCMYPLFTLHGSGHNPRGTKTPPRAPALHAQAQVFCGQIRPGHSVRGLRPLYAAVPGEHRHPPGMHDLMNGLAASGEACAID